jgi:rRNA-processing protein FCF1
MKILLDTSFILSCIKQKIDFVSRADELIDDKVEFILPEEVSSELKIISERKGEKRDNKKAAILALKIFEVNNFESVKLNSPHADSGLVKYINASADDLVLATLDKRLKEKVKGRILTIKGKNSLVVV